MIKQANLSIQPGGELDLEILNVLESGIFINGPYNKLFSEMWARVCGAQYCVSCSSGSAALKTALKFYKKKIGPNYAVVPNYSFAATLFSVMEAGYIPIFCPVDSRGLMNQEALLEILRKQEVSAIVPVHLYGQLLKLEQGPIKALSDAGIIEDACQVHGGLTEVQGDAACFSFYPSKNLGTIGDGGAIVTNNFSLDDWAKQYVNYGDYPGQKYVHAMQGDNLRLDEIKTAVLCKKLDTGQLGRDNHLRLSNAGYYHFGGIYSFVQMGLTSDINVYHQYPVLFEDRKKAYEVFNVGQIEVGNHYPYTLNTLAEQSYYHSPKSDQAQKIAEHVVTLPIGPHLKEEEIKKVIEVIHSNFKWNGEMFV